MTSLLQAVDTSFVVAVDAELGANGQQRTCFCQATKQYFLHVQSTSSVHEASFIDADRITHYCEPPLEAAFCGVFLHEAALRMYMSLYRTKSPDPYQNEALELNEGLLLKRAQQEARNSEAPRLSDGSGSKPC
jgi:hypothetical protein